MTNAELLLSLLKEEIKMHRFFTDLDDAGLENVSRFQLMLTPIIFHCAGVDPSDENIERYMCLLDESIIGLEPGVGVTAAALDIYSRFFN